ncbi:MAG: hypothetical protein Q4G68_06115 [Planctomycetia bacterium]|nr:hypothetical protein [Planctomycetia bacterium]
MKNFAYICISLISLCLTSGCNSARPDNFPKTVPFSLVVTRNGAPLDEANVQLIPSEASDVVTGGITNAKGVVNLHTVRGGYSQSGAPIGTFKVTVKKKKIVPGELTEEEFLRLNDEEGNAYFKKIEIAEKNAPVEVAEIFNSAETTPLVIEVTAGGSETIEVTAE